MLRKYSSVLSTTWKCSSKNHRHHHTHALTLSLSLSLSHTHTRACATRLISCYAHGGKKEKKRKMKTNTKIPFQPKNTVRKQGDAEIFKGDSSNLLYHGTLSTASPYNNKVHSQRGISLNVSGSAHTGNDKVKFTLLPLLRMMVAPP